ncbi:hypothetical protein RJ641_021620 [Dillenia turbinata]|uniref:F-box domain-containing protein n=1 Tax=Dillenia turbinata TaxID=194707 RepID=A0AAN8UK75_9MAGN
MEERKWEELQTDCLVNILKRVGIESLLLDVPLVCKTWYNATHNPLCWSNLIFPDLDPRRRLVGRIFYEQQLNGVRTAESHANAFFATFSWKFGGFSPSAFIRFVVKRSGGSATSLVVPPQCTEEDLKYLANECPALKFLELPSEILIQHQHEVSKLIRKWKKLEILSLHSLPDMGNIFSQINRHCKRFIGLSIEHGVFIGSDEVSAIVNFLPNIKHLSIRGAIISRENLLRILKGCKELVLLDATDCVGFVKDVEILKHAAHICCFKCEDARQWDEIAITNSG